jgi:hypothetical protein
VDQSFTDAVKCLRHCNIFILNLRKNTSVRGLFPATFARRFLLAGTAEAFPECTADPRQRNALNCPGTPLDLN